MSTCICISGSGSGSTRVSIVSVVAEIVGMLVAAFYGSVTVVVVEAVVLVLVLMVVVLVLVGENCFSSFTLIETKHYPS